MILVKLVTRTNAAGKKLRAVSTSKVWTGTVNSVELPRVTELTKGIP